MACDLESGLLNPLQDILKLSPLKENEQREFLSNVKNIAATVEDVMLQSSKT